MRVNSLLVVVVREESRLTVCLAVLRGIVGQAVKRMNAFVFKAFRLNEVEALDQLAGVLFQGSITAGMVLTLSTFTLVSQLFLSQGRSVDLLL